MILLNWLFTLRKLARTRVIKVKSNLGLQEFKAPGFSWRIKVEDLGILLFIVSFPFLNYPKIVPGDTQPWVIVAAVLALLTYRTHCFLRKSDVLLYCVAFLCVLVYLPRNFSTFEIVRYLYTFLAFVFIWAILQRGGKDYITLAVKWTILLWFLVGCYQYVSIKLGYSPSFSGRYVPGYSGVPSLASEPSFYGSLSVLQIMYLLSGRERNSTFFVILGLLSVLMSGSVLSMLLLIFPFIKVIQLSRLKLPFLVAGVFVTVVAFTLIEAPARIARLAENDLDMEQYLRDLSINLRSGHIYFTLVENHIESLFLLHPIDFQAQYNAFAAQSSLFVETGSSYILPSLGELIYGSGLFGLVLVGMILYRTQRSCRLMSAKLIKLGLVLACLLNPIPISNVFLIAYSLKRE